MNRREVIKVLGGMAIAAAIPTVAIGSQRVIYLRGKLEAPIYAPNAKGIVPRGEEFDTNGFEITLGELVVESGATFIAGEGSTVTLDMVDINSTIDFNPDWTFDFSCSDGIEVIADG